MKKLLSAINTAGMCLAPWMVAGAMTTGLVLSMPVTGIAQQQTPAYSPQQQAALKEAEELNEQVENSKPKKQNWKQLSVLKALNSASKHNQLG